MKKSEDLELGAAFHALLPASFSGWNLIGFLCLGWCSRTEPHWMAPLQSISYE